MESDGLAVTITVRVEGVEDKQRALIVHRPKSCERFIFFIGRRTRPAVTLIALTASQSQTNASGRGWKSKGDAARSRKRLQSGTAGLEPGKCG